MKAYSSCSSNKCIHHLHITSDLKSRRGVKLFVYTVSYQSKQDGKDMNAFIVWIL